MVVALQLTTVLVFEVRVTKGACWSLVPVAVPGRLGTRTRSAHMIMLHVRVSLSLSLWVCARLSIYVYVCGGGSQHVVFGLKILVAYLIPDVPGPVKMAIEREQYLQKLAFEGEEEGSVTVLDADLEEALRDMTGKKEKKRTE
jgi:hypothetical protein